MAENVNVEKALRDLLTLGVEASQKASQRTRLDVLKETDPDDWDDGQWDFANERGLIPADKQGEFELRLLERRQANERAALSAWQGGNNPLTGTATVGVASRQLPAVPERPVAATLVQEVDGPEGTPSEDAAPYEEWSNSELKEEINARNQSRADEYKLVPASNRKDDLSKALYEDDDAEEQRVAAAGTTEPTEPEE